MNTAQDIACPCISERTESHWKKAEARFQRAKQALLDIQQQHCAAADELLLARAQVRQILEAAFPGAEGGHHPPVSTLRSETRGDGS